jgi:GGDEF domain-containing protein
MDSRSEELLEKCRSLPPAVGLTGRAILLQRFDRLLLEMSFDSFRTDVADSFSHTAGDEVRRTVAGVLGSQVRANDIAARYGTADARLYEAENGGRNRIVA